MMGAAPRSGQSLAAEFKRGAARVKRAIAAVQKGDTSPEAMAELTAASAAQEKLTAALAAAMDRMVSARKGKQ